MKKLLIISFDFIRNEDPEISLAMGSILASIKNDSDYGRGFTLDHSSVNMFDIDKDCSSEDLIKHISINDFKNYDFIAISAYVWSESLLHKLQKYIRKEGLFKGKFILGGYQISYSDKPQEEYHDCEYFIQGYGENAFLKILKGEVKPGLVKSALDFESIPSPYLSGEIKVNYKQEKVRLETKRGCPFSCSFCAHRDLTGNKVLNKSLDNVFKELSFFKNKKVKKINILDPIFNSGNRYIAIMEEMIRLKLKSKISIQARFETIRGNKGLRFLNLCKQLNIHLEFGLQTSNKRESEIINRMNDTSHVSEIMGILNKRNISYEISLMYGLPEQTLKSFVESIEFVKSNACHNITAFPLMLLKGTDLYFEKHKYGFKEKKQGLYNIPFVVQTNSFRENEWQQMNNIADNLGAIANRI